MVGVTAFGAYIPRLRLSRKDMVASNGWIQPGLRAFAKGHRSICGWDEDSVTMAVEAARDCLHRREDIALRAIYLASTTLPFQDRQNAGIVAAALNLDEETRTMDVAGSQRAGVSALAAALEASEGASDGDILVVASDTRRARAASQAEMTFGDAAAAFAVGRTGLIAELIGHHAVAIDFVDHYRGENRAYDYVWEERWIRDEGYLKIVPRTISEALRRADVEAGQVDVLIAPSTLRGVSEKIAAKVGIARERLADALDGVVGESGCAHPLLMLAHVLENAKPGQIIAVAGFGQGCEVFLFRTTDAISDFKPRLGVCGHIARKREGVNYGKFMAFNDLVVQEKGMRAELDNQTALTQLFRQRDMLLGLVGGECSHCGTRQFPRARICVNPNCHAMNSQTPFCFADVPGKILTWSADHLTYCPDPPLHYGMVQFEGGGRFLANFTDADVGGVQVGQEVRMMFRTKDFDNLRGFRRYFWKAAPSQATEG